MDNHPIESLMRSTMENIRDMIDVNTIIGDPIEINDGSVIIPISKVSFGFASGGSEFYAKTEPEKDSKFPFGGGSGAGVSVKPVAFLIMKNDNIRLMSLDHDNTFDRIVDSAPQLIDMLKGIGKSKQEKQEKETANKTSCDKNDSDPLTTSDTI